jgi:glycosyltransferase 2 family protein
VEGQPRTLLERAGSAAAGLGQVGPKHPTTRLALQWGIAVLVFGFLVFFLARQWGKLPDFDWHFSPGWLVLAAVGVAGFYAGQCELWRPIVRGLGSDIPAPQGRAIWGKSILARYVPTSALMVVGRVVMAEKLGVPKRICLASVIYELGLSFGTAVMVGSYFVIVLPDLEGKPVRFLVLILIPLVLTVLHPRVFGPLANFGLRKLGREPLPRTLPFRNVLLISLGYVGTWALIGLGVCAFAAALHPLASSDLPYVAAAYPVAFCVAVITFIAPSGLGTRDAALAVGISSALPSAVATAIAVAFRLFQTVIELLFVAAVVALGRRAGDG